MEKMFPPAPAFQRPQHKGAEIYVKRNWGEPQNLSEAKKAMTLKSAPARWSARRAAGLLTRRLRGQRRL
jgi:hypothetical protein